MRVYKTAYKDRDGRKRRAAKWYIDIFDHNQLRHRIPAFADKRLSEALARNIEALVNCQIAGLEQNAKLNQSELKAVRYIFPVLSFFCITMIKQFYMPFTRLRRLAYYIKRESLSPPASGGQQTVSA